ncbi:universal stress protein [Kitasatospora sp. P5_F3]
MNGPVVVGFDGSPESVAAADWAAREARRRGKPLELVQAWPWHGAHVLGSDDAVRWAKQRLARKEVELRALLSGVEVSAAHIPDTPAAVLEAAGKSASLLVLGSRGLGRFRGFLIGSVSQEVLGRASCPVVVIRAGATAADEHLPGTDGPPSTGTPYREVTLGLDLRHRADEVIRYAFEAAALRSAPLRVVHAWGPPNGGEYLALAAIGNLAAELSAAEQQKLADTLKPWRERFPQVEVTTTTVLGSAALTLVEATPQAGLLVVGRRTRRMPLGPHLGPVAHAAVHHAPCPVVVVPFD